MSKENLRYKNARIAATAAAIAGIGLANLPSVKNTHALSSELNANPITLKQQTDLSNLLPYHGGLLRNDIVDNQSRLLSPEIHQFPTEPAKPWPWLYLLCRFSDVQETYDASRFYSLLSNEIKPYLEETSYSSLAGNSDVKGWYTLPHPQSYYSSRKTKCQIV